MPTQLKKPICYAWNPKQYVANWVSVQQEEFENEELLSVDAFKGWLLWGTASYICSPGRDVLATNDGERVAGQERCDAGCTFWLSARVENLFDGFEWR